MVSQRVTAERLDSPGSVINALIHAWASVIRGRRHILVHEIRVRIQLYLWCAHLLDAGQARQDPLYVSSMFFCYSFELIHHWLKQLDDQSLLKQADATVHDIAAKPLAKQLLTRETSSDEGGVLKAYAAR